LRRAARLAAALAAAGLAACAVGPDYVRPETPAPPEFRGQIGPAEATSLADLPWWEVFEDETLQGLVVEAIESNHDLAAAVRRVAQAEALVGVAQSPFYPQIGYQGSAGRQAQPRLQSIPRTTFSYFYGAFSLAWELDVWGRIRRSSEAAREALYATEEFRRGVLLSLVTGVAGAYLTLLELDRELAIARDTTESFEETLELFTRRFEGGVGNKLQVARAQAALSQTEAEIPDLERRIVFQENLISVLLGRNPGPIPRGVPFEDRQLPPATPPGLPSALLERRPDIRQAEAALVAANARIGVAKAAFFPQISLTGFFGVESIALSDLFTGPSRIWQFGPTMTVPIFNAGRNRANLQLTEARQRESLLRYEQSVQQAFREVEDALVAHRKAREAFAEQQTAVRASREALDIAESRYRSGLTNYLDVLDAQRSLLAAEIGESRTLLSQLIAVVQVYRALGGGWDSGSGS